MEEKEVDLGRDIFGEDEVVEPLLVVSERDAQPSVRLEARRVPVEALDASPIETETFKKHTWWPGLFFRTLRMERVYLDGYARLHKNLVYIGYLVVLTAFFLIPAQAGIKAVFIRQLSADCPEGVEKVCEQYRSQSPAALFWDSVRDYMIFIFPIMAGLTIPWSLLHWFVHRSKRVKEKTWAVIMVFVAYLIWILFPLFYATRKNEKLESGWPSIVMFVFWLIFPSFIFFSGSPSFVLYLLLCSVSMICYGLIYYVACLKLKDLYGPVNEQLQKLRFAFMWNAYISSIVVIISLCGAFRIDIASRKMFLQRMMMGDQQQEIIKQKTQNTKLQKKLLNNMLPQSIVEQLALQNFTIQSWDQLRRLSRRHSGVCIMFAELDGFTKFSAQVRPSRVMEYLNDLFLIFDGLCDDYDVYKVETVGDQYVAAVGVVTGKMHNEEVDEDEEEDLRYSQVETEQMKHTSLKIASMFNTKQMIGFAKAIIGGSRHVGMPEGADVCPRLRVGIHTGTCMSGIVGTRNFRFCLFGDTMNTAARMEQKSVAECIHTTQDVVDLVPDECWEKLKKIEVKGKGLMQTYLLRVASNQGVDESKAEVTIASLRGDADKNRCLDDEEEEGDADTILNASIGNLRVSAFGSSVDASSPSAYQDVQPVSNAIYRQHTVCFGLFFRKMHIERSYLDGQARLNETMVYFGYFLYVLVLLSNYLFGYIYLQIQYSVCRDPENKEICVDSFSPGAYDYAQSTVSLSSLSNSQYYYEIADNAAYRNIPSSAGILFGLVLLGCAAQWFIHSFKFVTEKSWAILSAWLIYTAMLVVMTLFVLVFARLPPYSGQWPGSVQFTILTLSMLLAFFANVTFILNLLWWIIAVGLSLGLGIYVVAYDLHTTQGEMKVQAIENAVGAVGLAISLPMYGIVLLIGSYLSDITSRKRFLQRILMVKQQNQIIKEKTFNETMQKQFLESILPSNLVEKLQNQQEKVTVSLADSVKRSSLSQRHLGVGMLYADLVGFTSFSAQVDPFKVMVFLNELFQVFDGLCDDFNVYKIETVGDCYVAAVGVVTGEMVTAEVRADAPDSPSDLAVSLPAEEQASTASASASNAADLIGFAKAMLHGSREVIKPDVNTPATLRIGVHSGSCISGVIGTRNLKFSLLGDDVVTAALMEKTGTPDSIHASEDIVGLVSREQWTSCKIVEGMYGQSFQTYLLET